MSKTSQRNPYQEPCTVCGTTETPMRATADNSRILCEPCALEYDEGELTLPRSHPRDEQLYRWHLLHATQEGR